VFKGYAERGKSSTGWFYGFKLYLTINDRDEQVTDRLCRELWGKLFGEGGYISRELFERLYRRDKTGNPAEKEYAKQADGNGRESFVTETGCDRISRRFSEEHPPNRAQPAPEFYQFYGESSRGVIGLQFLTA
jgi:hypothetical protein